MPIMEAPPLSAYNIQHSMLNLDRSSLFHVLLSPDSGTERNDRGLAAKEAPEQRLRVTYKNPVHRCKVIDIPAKHPSLVPIRKLVPSTDRTSFFAFPSAIFARPYDYSN